MKRIQAKKLLLAAMGTALVVGMGLAVLPLGAQTAISADGAIESTSVGFIFPDGTVQARAAPAGSAPVEDTGQQGCWDASGTVIACSGTGQDGELQAGVAWPAPRFTDNGNGTVTDNLTGLIWLKLADCFGQRTWTEALSDANGLMSGPCSLSDGSVATDWRLPNVKELLSLMDYGEFSPALPLGHPFTSVQSSLYWSSSSFVASPGDAWYVFLGDGHVDNFNKADNNYVWPVRGGQ